MSRKQGDKMFSCLIKLGYIVGGLFIVSETTLIVLVMLLKLDKTHFEIQLAVIQMVFILLMNFYMIRIYFKYAGTPYKSQ